MNHIAYLSLGTNIGDRLYYLREAVKALHAHEAICIEDVSSIYETEPVGYVDQENFLNIVVKISTSLRPINLLETTQSIELQLGRKREIHWGPRTIDLDILLYSNENMDTETLIIPHPRMYERNFVLVPLIELGVDISRSESVNLREGVRIWKRKNGGDVFELFES
ncbi:2-amino-4-hydroxy-6-hydroxymethyldihydropteridine diphosphokinase [Priestia taiwanensis]|uniref:2-amino-4-hydroxy-6-hydroxymethyldihydropteridine diphosphokinase n=1 Tax=Priestia taiwanensis TaxID=1347902 RepID=A0A917AXQ6_9BACI|nr:2-amino-4-hydroxy-6-hydroxymethyldihydropteridine diphosphokinase [Priestia taiwanensis]MBM7365153.1 2-amino-4-hydroxy-6-hydroxymethyldihydropteridine diphosphokinase [Priestia taiwanensis]GGE84872.1 2-amino-4-hydroxy-6-hydroxymethyldihydropteridine pyrophosphokinase [Priestia taiwanensis]